jgi:hypothetical protein
MEYVGIDLHKKESQICLLTEAGEVIECRIRSEPQRLAEVLGGRPRARILVEASTESEWVARCLEVGFTPHQDAAPRTDAKHTSSGEERGRRRHRGLLQAREQGRARLRGRLEQSALPEVRQLPGVTAPGGKPAGILSGRELHPQGPA